MAAATCRIIETAVSKTFRDDDSLAIMLRSFPKGRIVRYREIYTKLPKLLKECHETLIRTKKLCMCLYANNRVLEITWKPRADGAEVEDDDGCRGASDSDPNDSSISGKHHIHIPNDC